MTFDATPSDNAIRDADLREQLDKARNTADFPEAARFLSALQKRRDAGEVAPSGAPEFDGARLRDPDLRKASEGLNPDDYFEGRTLRSLIQEQEERDKKAEHLASLAPVVRRREIVRDNLAAPFLDENRHFLHSVLATCGLPYRRPPDDQTDYISEYFRSSLVVQAGYLKDPVTGKMVKQGLPYGPKARLMLLHICTLALKHNSNEIEIAESMSAFIRDLGFEVTGGARGTIAQFKEQLHRLAAAHMQIGLWRGEVTTTLKTQPIEAFDVWLPNNPNQKMLWNSRLVMDVKFFRTLREHALPVDIRGMRAFAHSAKQIDIVLWLFSRLNQLEAPVPISWSTLKDQFGRDIQRDRKFKESFAEDWRAITEVYPKLRSKVTEGGLVLHHGDGEIMLVPSKRIS